MKRILLVNPPWVRNAEPPLGLAMIQGDLQEWNAFNGRKVQSRIIDLNSLAALALPLSVNEDGSHRTHRAILHRKDIIRDLSSASGYTSPSNYSKSMQYYADLLRVLARNSVFTLTPGDFVDQRFSDFGPDSIDLMASSNHHPLMDPILPDLKTALEEFAPDTVGISINYRSQLSSTLRILNWIQDTYPDIRIVIGGAFLSCLSEKSRLVLRNRNVYVCSGPGEPFLHRLAGSNRDEWNAFSIPDFNGIDFSSYFAPCVTIPMITSRGCYWGQCAFCDECREPFKMDQIPRLEKRINSVLRQYHPGFIHFTDHALPPAILHAMANDGFPGVPWSGFVRAAGELTDTDFVRNLSASGCRMLQIGFETVSPHLLHEMNKGISPNLFPGIINTLRQSGIHSYVYIMFGYPGQTIDDCEETLCFLEKHPPDFLNTSVFRLPPGSPLAKSTGALPEKHSNQQPADRLYIEPPDGYSFLPDLRRWISTRFNKSGTIRKIQQQTPRYYKSSHAAFFK